MQPPEYSSSSTIDPGRPRESSKSLNGSILQAIFSGLGVIALLMLAFSLEAWILLNIERQGFAATAPMQLAVAGIAASGFLLLPSAVYAFLRAAGRPVKERFSGWGAKLILVILVWPIVLLLGHLAAQNPTIAWWLLPPLHLLAVGLPVLWILFLTVRGISGGSSQRIWGLFGTGLVLGPAIILVLEMLALLGLVTLAVLALSVQPQVVDELTALAEQLMLTNPTPEAALRMIAPYLSSPGLILTVLAFGAVIVPLIEEAFKPVGVWLLASRPLTPAEGFVAGALSGAGYAFFESVVLASTGVDWAFVVFARAGTAVVHILTTALTGYALVLAWQQGRYIRLGVTYLTVAAIHGLWNGLTLAGALAGIIQASGSVEAPILLARAGEASVFGLPLLALGGLLVLLRINRTVRAAHSPGPGVTTPLPAEEQAASTNQSPLVEQDNPAGEPR